MVVNNTFRILYLNLNFLNVFISILFVFWKLQKNGTEGEIISLSNVLTIQSTIAGYVGCTGVWFKSKSWIKAQIALTLVLMPCFAALLLLPVLGLNQIIRSEETMSRAIIIALMVIAIPQSILGYKYSATLNKQNAKRALQLSQSVPANLSSLHRSSTPVPGLYLSPSYTTLVESQWNLAPFGANRLVPNFQGFDSWNLVSSNPGINMMFSPNKTYGLNQSGGQLNFKDSVKETTV